MFQTHLVRVIKMTDFMFFIFTEVFGANLEDAHDIPWGTQFFFYPLLGFFIGMIVLRFIGNEKKGDQEEE